MMPARDTVVQATAMADTSAPSAPDFPVTPTTGAQVLRSLCCAALAMVAA
jgi:hypothetical protein